MKLTRLEELNSYYHATRQAGHTTLMIDGLNFARPAIFLFANMAQAHSAFHRTIQRFDLDKSLYDPATLTINNVRFSTIGWLYNLREGLRGMHFDKLPVVTVDHFAMEILINEHIEKLLKSNDQKM